MDGACICVYEDVKKVDKLLLHTCMHVYTDSVCYWEGEWPKL